MSDMHGIMSTLASSTCLAFLQAVPELCKAQSAEISWSFTPNQELGQTLVLLWSLCLGFLPVGAATLCKVGDAGQLVYNQLLS